MKTELFRRVPCEERLPEKIRNSRYSESVIVLNSEGKVIGFTSYDHRGEYWQLYNIAFWLEPVEPVSGHDLVDQFQLKYDRSAFRFGGYGIGDPQEDASYCDEYVKFLEESIHELIYGKGEEG